MPEPLATNPDHAALAESAESSAPLSVWAPKAAPALPGFPADQPISIDPVEGISLELYAKVAAALAEGRGDREAVLAEQRLNEMRWLSVEREWALRMAAAALRGDTSLAERYDRAYVAAQSELGPEQPTHPLAAYAVISAELESGMDPAPVVLARRGLKVADFARLSRFWNERLGQDSTLSKSFRQQVDDHKRRLRDAPESPGQSQ